MTVPTSLNGADLASTLVNWGPWAKVGMATTTTNRKWELLGVESIEPEASTCSARYHDCAGPPGCCLLYTPTHLHTHLHTFTDTYTSWVGRLASRRS